VSWHRDTSESDSSKVAKRAAAILSGEPNDADDQRTALASGHGRRRLTQRNEPISYREAGHLLTSSLAVFHPKIQGGNK
jgi:hypothetical protein